MSQPHTVSHPSQSSQSGNANQSHSASPQGRNQTLGAQGEHIAAHYLVHTLGWRVIARNWRSGRHGELDLIAEDGGSIVAVEVKTRSGLGYGNPLEAITARKTARLRRLLLEWVREQRPAAHELRVDAVGIILLPGVAPTIEHVRGII